MAKKSSIEKNEHRRALVKRYAARRAKLKGIADDAKLPMEERFEARLKLSELPATRRPRACAIAARCRAGRARSTAR